jgi:hypothetical protein
MSGIPYSVTNCHSTLAAGMFLSVLKCLTCSFVAVSDRCFTSMAFTKLTYNLMYK